MRLFAVLVAVCALSPPAIAQTPDCKAIPDAGARLACYDKAASANKPTAGKPASPMSATGPAAKADPGKYVDAISAEDARMNAQLKNICRGC
jgi:hypothetical protein